jgi:hypothetical protein
MSYSKKLTVKIKETGEIIEVYQLRNGNYHDWHAVGADQPATSKTGKKEFKKEEVVL